MRKTGIELLRVLAMIAVIMGHCLLFDIHFYEFKPYTINYFIGYFIKAFTVPAVNCYMLISGYFLVTSQFKLRKLLSLYSQIWFWSIIVLVLNIFLKHTDLDIKTILNHVFPVQGGMYWYATAYVMVYCLIPIYNRSINSMSKKQFQMTLFGLIILFSVLPTIFYFNDTYNLREGLSFVWLSVVYFTGAYIRLYPPQMKTKKVFLLYIALLVWLVAQSAISNINVKLQYLPIGYIQFHYKSPIVYLMSICIFILFERIKWKNKFVVKIASLTFGIYLFSEAVRQIVCNSAFMNSLKHDYMWWLHIILATIIVFALCGGLEIIRKTIFNIFKVDNVIYRIEATVNKKLKIELNNNQQL